MNLPTRAEADAILATQPWARVCKELALFVTQLSVTCTPERATETVLEAVARARVELWSFHDRTLWAFLTDLVGKGAASPEARAQGVASAASIPMLDSEELDRELRRFGLDPDQLSALGARIKKEAILRAPRRAPSQAPAQVAAVRVARTPPEARRDRRPEMPTLSRAQWAALSMVVLVTAALALLGAVAASRSL